MLKFRLDTGARVNVNPLYIFNVLKLSDRLRKTNIKISNYGGTVLDAKSSCSLIVISENNIKQSLDFIVVDTKEKSVPILGIDGIQRLSLTQRSQIVSVIKTNLNIGEYPDIFEGIARIRSAPCNIKLKKEYEAVVVPCRRIAFRLLELLKAELHKMVKDGIICKQTEPSEFCNLIVIVRKPDNFIRICLDPQNLNAALMREHFEIRTFEELTIDIAGSIKKRQ